MSIPNQILQILKQTSNSDLVLYAFEFAKEAHHGQKRLSGEDYISHPLAVASILSEMQLDSSTIAAALLHDVVDDTPRTIEDIEKEFGKEIAFLVDGVSKLGRIRIPKQKIYIKPVEIRKEEPIGLEIENLRKMFFAMAEDLRVILIKLADRLHNMQTLGVLPPEKQKRIALETMEIFAPIANRLGMGEIKGQLEDLAFPYLYPKEFYWLQARVGTKYEEQKKYLEKVKPIMRDLLIKQHIEPIDIHSRAKHYWSLYQKLLRHEMNFEKIHDLVALRLILNTTENCYKALGIIHQHFKPLPGLIKDYIAFPKPNYYRSLHTTCFCVDGKITEIQIKTLEMHQEAEYGVAAHWAYKEGINLEKSAYRKKFAWVQQLKDWQKEAGSKEFLEGLKIDFFKNRVFVFTPKGDVIDLPEGSTVVDFAYAVHTEIGEKCAGAKINGKIAPLHTQLSNGDVVQILVDKNKKPSRDWLEFVQTQTARSKIREWLKKESLPENLQRGTVLLNKELVQLRGITLANLPSAKKKALLSSFGYKDFNALLVAIGAGELSPSEVTKTLFKEDDILKPIPKISFKPVQKSKDEMRIALAGTTGISINLAKCCNPGPENQIMGYITRGRGATIHKPNCQNLVAAIKKWPHKVIEASWTTKGTPWAASLEIRATDRVGLLRDLSSTISSMNINILSCVTTPRNRGEQSIVFKVEVSSIDELTTLFKKLRLAEGVKWVGKV